ncbi:MAG: hypothetical protein JXR96_14130 [Deltaproteobacteria bacterium]|nr:hypothetical protein [Deltaproteobacteria bacterium]
MRLSTWKGWWLLGSWLAVGPALAQDESAGQVRMPLDAYQALSAKASEPRKPEQPPPVAAALSEAEVSVRVPEQKGQPARVSAKVTVHVLSSDWVAVPLLPAGTAVESVRSSSGNQLALADFRGDLAWSTKDKGTHELVLSYQVAVSESATGRCLHLPVPPAAAIKLEASLPGQGLAASVIPASGFELSESGSSTELRASVPRTRGVQIAWRVPGEHEVLILGADYQGSLEGEVVRFRAGFRVRVTSPEPVSIPLLAASAALSSARADGKQAVVQEVDDKLAVQVQGAGQHEIELRFEAPVSSDGGPPSCALWLPRPPLSSFELSLPGDKELTVTPHAGVELQRRAGKTLASVHIPPSDEIVFAWSSALPEAVKEQLRANAEVYHVVQAEEGVLQAEALVAFQVTRGATHSVSARLPAEAAINRVVGDGVSDWRVAKQGAGQELTIFLDREIKGDYRYTVGYERLLGADASAEQSQPVAIPLLVPSGVHRQRGMVALLSGSELSIKPQDASGMNKVGENQLPAWVRQPIKRTVAHTYKYIDPEAQLTVRLAPPERKRGKFDAVVDTLLSVGEGVMKASASVEIAIKTGRLMDLDLTLPPDVSLVGVTAPSLRDHKLAKQEAGSPRLLQLMFTQELEGTLRIEVAYERVLRGGQEKVEQVGISAIHVPGADNERGRLAVEALTAVEIDAKVPAGSTRISPLDVQELPRQLTLRTTNPILKAFKYTHGESPFQLNLLVKHHSEMSLQVAVIDQASYQTLFTRHGLALTLARYRVRNRSSQFLKIQLPEGSTLWTAQRDGKSIKMAGSDREWEVLVPLINSDTGFDVEVVYATKIDPMGLAGWIAGELPVPDIVETRSAWDVYLPVELSYGGLDTNMSEKVSGELSTAARADFVQAVEGKSAGEQAGRAGGVMSLPIDVPRRGVHYSFERLFANRGQERSSFSMHYTTSEASTAGGVVLMLGIFLLAALIAMRLGLARRPAAGMAAVLLVVAALAIVLPIVLLDAPMIWAVVAGAISVVAVAVRAVMQWQARKSEAVQGA